MILLEFAEPILAEEDLIELSFYEDLNGTQIATQHQFTAGISYRFMLKEDEVGGVLK